MSLDEPLAGVGRNLLVETEAGRTIVRRTQKKATHKLTAFLPDGRTATLEGLPGERTVRQAVASVTSARPLRAFRLPSGDVESKLRPLATVVFYLPWVVGGLLVGAGAFTGAFGFMRFAMLAAGITIMVVAQDAFKKSQAYREWALTSKEGTVRAIEFPLPDLAEEAQIDDVKEEYGRLLSDIVYRIECPALFDPHQPVSKEFTLALLQWDNNDGVANDDERRELARRVRATFAAARANAERIGMDHLPVDARGKAGTALKAARLAVDEKAPAPERETALRRAVEILDQLALYYLPTGAQARRAITGGAPLQLPGRRSS